MSADELAMSRAVLPAALMSPRSEPDAQCLTPDSPQMMARPCQWPQRAAESNFHADVLAGGGGNFSRRRAGWTDMRTPLLLFHEVS